METFVCRFQLSSVHTAKAAVPAQDPETGEIDKSRYVMKPSAQVSMQAVRGDDETDSPFGLYTPSGKIEMAIANPHVAAFLTQLWHAYVMRDESVSANNVYGGTKPPKFEVAFRHVTD